MTQRYTPNSNYVVWWNGFLSNVSMLVKARNELVSLMIDTALQEILLLTDQTQIK